MYMSTPTIDPIPELNLVSEIVAPPTQHINLDFELKDNGVVNTDDYYNNPGATKTDNNRPSVIIAVPEETVTSGKKTKEYEELDDYNKVFRTSGYYNEAEQSIEKALLIVGFDVLDRSKFEAKLRDLRDNATTTPYLWSSYTEKMLKNGEFDIVKESYKKIFENNEISAEEYMRITTEIDNRSKTGLLGEKREEDEMNDIAEVIRAAQNGEDQADYLLQINEVSVSNASNKTISIRDHKDVVAFMANNPDLQFGSESNNLPANIQSTWLSSDFNAKLIDIRSGSIVWLGTHTIESWAAEPIMVNFQITKAVNNLTQLNSKIKQYNSTIKKQNNELIVLKSKLEAKYQEAVTRKKLESKDEVKIYRKTLTNEIASLEESYRSLLTSHRQNLNNPPSNKTTHWTYTYTVSKPIIKPDLLGALGTQASNEQLLKHRKKLITQVTKELIGTINI